MVHGASRDAGRASRGHAQKALGVPCGGRKTHFLLKTGEYACSLCSLFCFVFQQTEKSRGKSSTFTDTLGGWHPQQRAQLALGFWERRPSRLSSGCQSPRCTRAAHAGSHIARTRPHAGAAAGTAAESRLLLRPQQAVRRAAPHSHRLTLVRGPTSSCPLLSHFSPSSGQSTWDVRRAEGPHLSRQMTRPGFG